MDQAAPQRSLCQKSIIANTQAQKENFRSRAAFKLEEIDQKYGILKPSSQVLDIGSSPGSWSQYIRRNYEQTKVVAVDLLQVN